MTASIFSPPANDNLLTTRAAGRMMGVSTRSVQLWVEAGVLPCMRTPGGHRRIRESDVIAYKLANSPPTASRVQSRRSYFEHFMRKEFAITAVYDEASHSYGPNIDRLFIAFNGGMTAGHAEFVAETAAAKSAVAEKTKG